MADVYRQLVTVTRWAIDRTVRQTIRDIAFAILVCGAGASSSFAAGPFSQLIVFGDSLSDVGNIQAATFGIYPGDGYHDGRFSNGPVFVESLSAGLGLGPTIRSSNSGDNYAYGGAKTAGTGGFDGLFILDINEQVTEYLPRTTDPGALFLILAGANDLLGSSDVDTPVNSLAADLDRLIDDGARNLLVLNLPLLGYTPRFNQDPTNFTTYNTRTEQFNGALSAMLDGLQTNNPAIELFRFDVAALFGGAIANPQWFGLTNVTDPAAPGLAPAMSSYDERLIVPNEQEYMFWDDLHPTEIVHAILAERLLMQLAMAGDFNRDSTADAADYVAWRKRQGSIYTPPDLNTWTASFGETASTGGAAGPNMTAPEPSSWAAGTCFMFALGSRRRYNEVRWNSSGTGRS